MTTFRDEIEEEAAPPEPQFLLREGDHVLDRFWIEERGGLILDGGAAFDRVSYESDPNAVTVTFTGSESGSVVDGYGGADEFSDAELILGSEHNDVFTGSVGSQNVFIGLKGEETFNGNGGTAGNANVHDIVDYSHDVEFGAVAGVTVNLHAHEIQGGLAGDRATDSFGDTDTVSGIQDVIGTQFDDQLYGGGHDNVLSGGAGNDLLLGNAEDDILDGGADTDISAVNDAPTLVGDNLPELVTAPLIGSGAVYQNNGEFQFSQASGTFPV